MSGGHRAPRKSLRESREERARQQERERLEKVVSRMSVTMLLEHLDMVGTGISGATNFYRKDDSDIYLLLEIRRCLDELQVVARELILRHEAAHEDD